MHTWPQLPRPAGARRRLVLAWLALALTALGVSTVFAVLLVAARTPWLADGLAPDFFHNALVMHVNLAVTVWFLAFAAVWWSLYGPARIRFAAWGGWALAVAGVCLLLLARLFGEHTPVLANYVPVIDGPVFLTGLGLFLAGAGLAALRLLPLRGEGLLAGARLAALVTLLALGMLGGTALLLPPAPVTDFENLFWGGGHLLQFTHVLLLIGAWMVLAGLAGLPPLRLRPRALFALAALPALFAPLILFLLPPGSEAWRTAWTELMRWGSWPAVLVFGLWLARRLPRAGGAGPWRSALGFSIGVFAAGLFAGALIRDDTVMVTAHYHGTVGAITLAFMAVTHHLLDRLGLAAAPARRIRQQLRLYGSGLLLLVAGLLWSGLHGVARKTPGTHMLDQVQEWAGMLLMGVGGFIGLAATVWFLWLVVRPLWPAVTGTLPAAGVEKAG